MCDEEDNKDNLKVFTPNKKKFSFNYEYYFKVYTWEFNGKTFNTEVYLSDGAILTMKNVRYIEVPLDENCRKVSTIYNKDEFNCLDKYGMEFYFCPFDKVEKHLYYFISYNGTNSIAKVNRYNKCNLEQCDIGFHLHKQNTDSDKLKKGGTIDYALYIALKVKPDEPILFTGVKIYKNAFPLVPCPYINWIPKLANSSFVPSSYVNENTMKLMFDFDKHILVPAYMLTQQLTFICGNIKQLYMHDVSVGFQFTEDDEETNPSIVKAYNDVIICDKKDISNYQLFGYLENAYNIDSDVPIMKYLKNDYKFYSGQKIYSYDGGKIFAERILAMQSKKSSPQGNIFVKSSKPHEIYYYKPACYGTILDKSAVLKPKVSNIVQKESDKMVFKITNQGVNAGNKISCHAVVEDDYNGRFSDFYVKRYKTKIQRVKDSKGQPVNESKAFEIPIIDDADKFYGTYKCELENPGSVKLISEKEFVILPGEVLIHKNDIYLSNNDKDALRCDLKSAENLTLYELRVRFDNGRNFKYSYFKKEESNEIFKLEKDYVTYNLPSFNDLKNGIVISCLFGLPGGKNSMYETTYYLKNDIVVSKPVIDSSSNSKNSENSENSKMFIIIGCAVGVLVVLVIIIAIIIVILKKKKTTSLQEAKTPLKNTAPFKNTAPLKNTTQLKNTAQFKNTQKKNR
uniref:Ig-like domain-containing protein n=1 Tax=Strongyloides stercoralis TaxID=6248 RepID=A0AAF5CV45_STRER